MINKIKKNTIITLALILAGSILCPQSMQCTFIAAIMVTFIMVATQTGVGVMLNVICDMNFRTTANIAAAIVLYTVVFIVLNYCSNNIAGFAISSATTYGFLTVIMNFMALDSSNA